MQLLLFVSLVCSVAAFPLDEDLLEGSGAINAEFESDTAAADLGLTQADPVPSSADAHIMSQTYKHLDVNFNHGFSSSDGTSVETFGEQKKIGDGVGTVMRGSYYYVAPGGEQVKITWVADESGFRAFGPMVPEAPAYLAKVLPSSNAASDRSQEEDVDQLDEEELLLSPVQPKNVPVAETDVKEAPTADISTAAKEVTADISTVEEVLVIEEAPVAADIYPEEAPGDYIYEEEAPDTMEVPVEETLVEEAPVEVTLVEEAPVEEAHVEEVPVAEALVEETPVEEAFSVAEKFPVQDSPVAEEVYAEETADVDETYVEATIEDASADETVVIAEDHVDIEENSIVGKDASVEDVSAADDVSDPAY